MRNDRRFIPPAKTGQPGGTALVIDAGEVGLGERWLWISPGAYPCPRLGAITSDEVKFARLSPYDAKAECGRGPGLPWELAVQQAPGHRQPAVKTTRSGTHVPQGESSWQ
jgi:hypothetical protein